MLATILTLTSVAILLRIIVNPLSNVFQKQLTQRSAEPLFVTCATYGFLTLACLFFPDQIQFSALSSSFWQSMIACAVLAVIGNVFLVKAMHIGDLSVLGPINAYKAVISLLVGIILLNEIPSWVGLAGVFLIVLGSYVVLSNSQQERGFSWALLKRPEVRLRLIALLCSGIDGVFLKKAIVLSTANNAFFYWCAIGFVVSFIWVSITLRHQWLHQVRLFIRQKTIYLALFISVGLMQLSTNIAFSGTQVGYALALFQTSALLSVLFGYQFFKESDIARKLIGAAIMVAGAVLIVVFK